MPSQYTMLGERHPAVAARGRFTTAGLTPTNRPTFQADWSAFNVDPSPAAHATNHAIAQDNIAFASHLIDLLESSA